jgi:hypothetical protein
MRRLLFQTVGCIVVLAATLVSSRVVGSSILPPEIANFRATLCESQPCWNGIRPGKTQFDEALAMLDSKEDLIRSAGQYEWCPRSDQCWQFKVGAWNREKVGFIYIQPPQDTLALGDVVLALGQPVASTLCWIAGSANGNVPSSLPRPVMIGYIAFEGNIRVATYNSYQPMLNRFSPEMSIIWLEYQPVDVGKTPPWQGFVAPARLGCSR